MSSRVLVTGAAGFIGSHLTERLLANQDAVICLDNFNDFYDPQIKRENIIDFIDNSRFHLIEGDIRDSDLVEKIFRDYSPDAVVHLAAMAGVRPSIEDPLLYNDVNVNGTCVLLEAARKYPVSNFLFGSSSSVYGARDTVPFSEKEEVSRPISPYAATKVAGEILCYTYHHLYNIPVTCLRFFTVYGPRQRPEMAIHLFARLIRDEEVVPIFGDGSSRRDYTYIDDIIDGVLCSLERPFGYEIINLGESQTVALMELVTLLEKGLGKKANLEMLPDQPGDVPVTFADVSRARELLGYEPSISIEKGIEKFVEWFVERKKGD